MIFERPVQLVWTGTEYASFETAYDSVAGSYVTRMVLIAPDASARDTSPVVTPPTAE